MRLAVAVLAASTVPAGVAAAPSTSQVIVVTAPGSPGTTEDAQSRLDAFAAAASARSGIRLGAVYEPGEREGVQRLAAAGLGIVSLPFFLAHERELGLRPRLDIVMAGRPALERWTLVAQKGRVKGAAGLASFTIVSSVAFAPAFIRGPVLGAIGALPASAKLVQSTSVLSALRRAASGEPVAVVLDGPQEAALASLPFASKLEVVARSPALPAGVVVTVDERIAPAAWSRIERGLLDLTKDRGAAPVLGALEIARFAPLDDKALATARKAFASAP